jgi:NAD(P)-dependent dehydrogenase (short-subunit alcohol dehydrogenase family)
VSHLVDALGEFPAGRGAPVAVVVEGVVSKDSLAAEGAKVVAGALTVDGLEGIDGVAALALDLVEPGGSERLVGEALERYGRVDVLVNNVGGVRLRRRQGSAPQRRQSPLTRAGAEGNPINSVSPGPVATDLWLGDHGVAATIGAATGVDAAAVREQAIASMPAGRFTTPEEVATLVALLASPRTANVTGSNYVIDGGLIKTM